MRALCLGLLALSLAACEDIPRKDYDDFRERTARARAEGQDGETGGSLQDLTGRWLLHALLQGGIDLGLIVELEPATPPAEGELPRVYTSRIWLWRQDLPLVACDASTPCPNNRTCNRFGTCDSPPLVVTTTTVNDDGTFQLIADPLDLGTEVLNSAEPVKARVVMNSRSTSADNWCGDAEGSVVSPLTLNLAGSRFSAFRHVPQDWICKVAVEDGEPRDCVGDEVADNKNYEHVYEALPFKCAAQPGDVEPPAPDMGVAPDGGPTRPAAPDLSAVDSMARDLTGNWLLDAKVNGAIPLQLWLSMIYTAGADGSANLDGALRSVTASPGTPALATFTTTVGADGRFEIWLPGLSISTDLATVQADILLAGATLPDGICGIAAGQVNQPPLGALTERTTFHAEPWDPTTEVPMGRPFACPAE
ncbi:MAG: hypothetical protein R3F60_14360 [bacterium]